MNVWLGIMTRNILSNIGNGGWDLIDFFFMECCTFVINLFGYIVKDTRWEEKCAINFGLLVHALCRRAHIARR